MKSRNCETCRFYEYWPPTYNDPGDSYCHFWDNPPLDLDLDKIFPEPDDWQEWFDSGGENCGYTKPCPFWRLAYIVCKKHGIIEGNTCIACETESEKFINQNG